MNNESARIETIRDLYAAFGRGDIPAILVVLDPDVEATIPIREVFTMLAFHAIARRTARLELVATVRVARFRDLSETLCGDSGRRDHDPTRALDGAAIPPTAR